MHSEFHGYLKERSKSTYQRKRIIFESIFNDIKRKCISSLKQLRLFGNYTNEKRGFSVISGHSANNSQIFQSKEMNNN